MKSTLIFIAIFASLSSAIAQEKQSSWMPSTIGLHLHSHHAKRGLYNDNTPGVMLGFANGLVIGAYENSNSRYANLKAEPKRYSAYASYRMSTDAHYSFSAALDVGVALGYQHCGGIADKCKNKPMFYAMPSVAAHYGNSAFRVSALPKGSGLSSLVHFSVEHKFK